MDIKIQLCTLDDLNTLQKIGYETFDETFRSLNAKETIDKYLQEAFNMEKLAAELNNKKSKFHFLYVNDELAGYLKINEEPAQTDINDPQSIEIERIYISERFKGKGLGKKLMNLAIQLAISSGKNYVWLGVWERNIDAISFYTRMGFSETGRHTFKMGTEDQTDLIMKKIITK